MFYLIHIFYLFSRFRTQKLPTRRIIRFNPYASTNGVFVNNSILCGTINTLFYISYIQYSRYQDPLTAAPVSLETLLEQYANKIALDKPTNATKP